jgi:hypothetical protein
MIEGVIRETGTPTLKLKAIGEETRSPSKGYWIPASMVSSVCLFPSQSH